MERLSDFRAQLRRPAKKRWEVEIRDEKTGQALVIEHDGPLDAFNIDCENAGWRNGEAHTDGIVVGDIDGRVVVCFVELTGRLLDEPSSAQRKLRQLVGSAEHFHPFDRGSRSPSHGAMRHDAFASHWDSIEPLPDKEHEIIGVVVANRQGARAPTPPVEIGRRTMSRQFGRSRRSTASLR